MYKARKNVEIKGRKRDIIEEYADFGSTVYAPITRQGLSLDKKANKYEVQPEALSSYAGLNELHNMLLTNKPGVFESKISVKKVRAKHIKGLTRKDVQHKAALEKAQEFIDALNEQKNDKKKDDLKNNPLAGVVVRSNTPEHKASARKKNFEDEKTRAIILLQRLIRGRAEQNMMFEGKEKRLDLITELRATEEWRRQSELPEERMLIENYQERVLDGVAEAL